LKYKIINYQKRKSPTPNSLPTRILSDRKCKNAIKPKELTGDMGSFITKKTKSKKKKVKKIIVYIIYNI
jgi:hypothetical protein